MNIRLCTMTNYYLDADYIEEFCEHYYNLGIGVIYLMDDLKNQEHALSELEYVKRNMDEGRIVYIPRYDNPNQHGLYDVFYEKHKNEFDWCCFFDADEFLVLNKHTTIEEYILDDTLKLNEKADAITVSWFHFGDSGHIHRVSGKVVENYTKPVKTMESVHEIETKVIVRGGLDYVRFFLGHCAICNENAARTCYSDGTSYAGRRFIFPYNKISFEYAVLNHYYTKSTEDFIHRKSTGRLDIPDKSWHQVLLEYKDYYFALNDWTEEKEEMFNEALERLK